MIQDPQDPAVILPGQDAISPGSLGKWNIRDPISRLLNPMDPGSRIFLDLGTCLIVGRPDSPEVPFGESVRLPLSVEIVIRLSDNETDC